jgi:hypothetical protein
VERCAVEKERTGGGQFFDGWRPTTARWIIVEIRGGTEESAKGFLGAEFLREIAPGSGGYSKIFIKGPILKE